jgi:hypothetical protein
VVDLHREYRLDPAGGEYASFLEEKEDKDHQSQERSARAGEVGLSAAGRQRRPQTLPAAEYNGRWAGLISCPPSGMSGVTSQIVERQRVIQARLLGGGKAVALLRLGHDLHRG